MCGSWLVPCTLIALTATVSAAPATPLETVEEADVQDPKVQACVSFALKSFNFGVRGQHLYTVTDILSVKRANVGGGKYYMDLQLSETSCSRTDPQDSCNVLVSTEAKAFLCHFVVLRTPWRKMLTLLQSSCTVDSQ